ncbi:MAG: tRNA (N(6)-L-threonylcarbamoyladenosine(37)-C(2))-methylthiotransferase [Nanoarchaeota archaeon]
MLSIYIKTYGCAANYDDSALLAGLLKKNGYKLTNNASSSDIIIINSCVVKDRTYAREFYEIKKIKEDFPNKKLVIAGCMAESESKKLKKLFPDALLVSPQHITDIINVLKENTDALGKRRESKLGLPKIITKTPTVQIAYGCNSYCTFCETKLAKGPLVSFQENDIINEIKNYIKNGYKRINLTSTDNGCYGMDIKTSLPNLLKKIIKPKGDFKIRVGMMNPEHVKKFLNELIEIYKSRNIIKFLHIPVQSGSNKVLKDMNRKYTVQEFKKIVTEFRKNIPNLTISTDIILGYPTETKKDFQQTINLIKQIKPEVLNISKFSPRPGTKTAKLKLLPTQEVKRRSVITTKIFNKIRKSRKCFI